MSGRRAVALVALREIRERLRSRAFRYSTLFLLILVGASTAFANMFESGSTYRVAATAPAPSGLAATLERAATPFDATVRLTVVRSAAAGREDVARGRVDALILLAEDRLVFHDRVDAKLAGIVDAGVRAVRRHLPPAPELRAVLIEPARAEPSDAEIAVASFGAILMILALSIYGQWVLVGVVEEKSNRVVELILSTVRPRHLLVGKVIGIGLLGLMQLGLVAGLAAALIVAGAFDAPAALGASLTLVIPWFALGFALYAVALAAAGALASRQQDAATAGQPVTIMLLASYLAGYAALSASPDGAMATALTLFPPSAPLVLPARSALVGVPAWQHAVAVVLMVVAIAALVRFAGRVYSHGLLHAGPRIDARRALRLARGR